MSRLTAAQVITQGDYLQPDFDPASLTVNQLLGVFGYHNINFPTSYTKPKLVQLFNEEIKAKATKLQNERLKKDNTLASDDGINDGVTGKPLTEKPGPARRTSRRLSRTPAEQAVAEESGKAEPLKRRRSSAQPQLGSTSKRKAAAPLQGALAEESEPEEVPVRKIIRSKKTAEVRQQTPLAPEFAEDSGWEDNNVFQSGAESSPARPSPTKRPTRKVTTQRTAAAPRRGRKASSAPPEPASSSPRPPVAAMRILPSQSEFTPQLSPATKAEMRKIQAIPPRSPPPYPVIAVPSMVKEEDEFDESDVPVAEEDAPVARKSPSPRTPTAPVEEEKDRLAFASQEAVSSQQTLEDDEEESRVVAISKRISEGGKQVARRTTSSPKASVAWRLVLAVLALLLSASVLEYKNESVAIGFCDTGSNTNDVLEQRKAHRQAIEACNAADSPHLHPRAVSNSSTDTADSGAADAAPCPPPAIVPLPHPNTCTPCPPHASCSRRTVVCDNGYLLKPHPLLALLPPPPPSSPSSASGDPAPAAAEFLWTAIGVLFDGLPNFGPVAFPPRCVVDPERERTIGTLGRAIKSLLGQEHGSRLCTGERDHIVFAKEDGGEARRWGVEIESLGVSMKERVKDSPRLVDTFDETFRKAIQQLIQWGGVITGEDKEGKKYLARETPDLSWNCALTVKARNTWREWRLNIMGTVFLLAFARYSKQRRATRRVEDKRVGELVQIALDTLRNQELAHHTDPVTAPHPFLSSLQLRDLVLQDEHSVGARARLWDRVERVVEGNANVRANLEEVEGGDELRVWRWIGGGGRIPIQSGEQAGEE